MYSFLPLTYFCIWQGQAHVRRFIRHTSINTSGTHQAHVRRFINQQNRHTSGDSSINKTGTRQEIHQATLQAHKTDTHQSTRQAHINQQLQTHSRQQNRRTSGDSSGTHQSTHQAHVRRFINQHSRPKPRFLNTLTKTYFFFKIELMKNYFILNLNARSNIYQFFYF